MEKPQQQAVAVQFIEVPEEFCNQRIDNFLFARLKGVPKSRIYRMLRSGEVRVNKGRTQAKYRLSRGDVIRLPPIRMGETKPAVIASDLLQRQLENRILFEDEQLLIIDKPSGMPVHGGSNVSFGVIEAMRVLRPQARFLELVHRLDRDTSGCLMIAKKRSALLTLHELFREDRVNKRYLALLAGRLERKRVTVDARLVKNVKKGGERMVTVDKTGKPAETEFRCLRCLLGATLVEASPKTGRTHQIRVHASHLGHPILGDTRYGEDAVNRAFRKRGLKRLFLHAQRLAFVHPGTGEPMRIEAPLEAALKNFLELLDEKAF